MNLCVQCGQYNSTTHVCAPRAMQFIAELPSGYDERTRMALTPDNRIVLVHPDMPVVVLDERSNVFVPLAPDLSAC